MAAIENSFILFILTKPSKELIYHFLIQGHALTFNDLIDRSFV